MNGYSLSTKRKVFIAISKKELNLKNKQYYKWLVAFGPRVVLLHGQRDFKLALKRFCQFVRECNTLKSLLRQVPPSQRCIEIVYGGLIHAKVEREFDELWWFINIVEVDSLLVFGSICDIFFFGLRWNSYQKKKKISWWNFNEGGDLLEIVLNSYF